MILKNERNDSAAPCEFPYYLQCNLKLFIHTFHVARFTVKLPQTYLRVSSIYERRRKTFPFIIRSCIQSLGAFACGIMRDSSGVPDMSRQISFIARHLTGRTSNLISPSELTYITKCKHHNSATAIDRARRRRSRATKMRPPWQGSGSASPLRVQLLPPVDAADKKPAVVKVWRKKREQWPLCINVQSHPPAG